MIKIGNIEVTVISGGKYRLDGGAMFGVVPKPLWERLNPSDNRNRIELETNCLYIKSDNRNILVDTGCGSKFNEKERNIYSIEEGGNILTSLKKKDIDPCEIDLVILSHLHFDHAGGATQRNMNGKAVPAFKNARYIIQEGEYNDAVNGIGIMKYTYLRDNFLPLADAGTAELVNGSHKVVKGVTVQVTGGHTRCHQIVFIESEGQRGVYLGDLIPTSSHLRPAYGMAYDLFPLEVKEKKAALLNNAADDGWIIFFDHEPAFPYCRLSKENGSIKIIRLYE